MKRKDGVTMGIWLDYETKGEIERLAKRIGITPSMFCRNLVVVGLQETKTMEKIGVLQASVMFQELQERVRARLERDGERFGGLLQEHSPA
jgi:hypothetical protein